MMILESIANNRLQADTATELDALPAAILPSSPGFGGTGGRAWSPSPPPRSVVTLSLREIRFTRSRRAQLKGAF